MNLYCKGSLTVIKRVFTGLRLALICFRLIRLPHTNAIVPSYIEFWAIICGVILGTWYLLIIFVLSLNFTKSSKGKESAAMQEGSRSDSAGSSQKTVGKKLSLKY